MTAAFHEFGRRDAQGAVVHRQRFIQLRHAVMLSAAPPAAVAVRRKGFVQLHHDTPQSGALFHQIDLIARFGQVKGGLDSGNTTPNYHNRTGCLLYCVSLIHEP